MEDSLNGPSVLPVTLLSTFSVQDSPIHSLWREGGMTPIKVRPLFIPQSAVLEGLIEEKVDIEEDQEEDHSAYSPASCLRESQYSPQLTKLQHRLQPEDTDVLEQQQDEELNKDDIPFFDIFGNQIKFPELSQFKTHTDRDQRCSEALLPVCDQKQNEDPHIRIDTPSKTMPQTQSHQSVPYTTNRKRALRSPLQDITPSVAKKHKKVQLGTTALKHSIFNTPRTLTDSGVVDRTRLRLSRM